MRRARGYTYRANEAELTATPEEETIKPMTKGEKAAPVTMHDIFAHRTEAHLTSKVMGKEVDFDSCFEKLLKDIKAPRDNYYRGKDIRNGWDLTLEAFMDLTPYYKAHFNACTRDSMRLLLLQTRKAIIKLQTSDPNRYKKRKYRDNHKRSSSDDPIQLFRCAEAKRLTPLENTFYGNFFEVLSYKRVGIVANVTYNMFINERRAYDDKFLAPFVTHNGIKFIFQGVEVNLKNWMKGVPADNIRTNSKLATLNKAELTLKGAFIQSGKARRGSR